MQIKKFNISKPKKYIGKDGIEKTQWNQIGVITEFHKEDGSVSKIIEIPAIGLEANIFPFQPREEQQPKSQTNEYNQTQPQQEKTIQYENGEVPQDEIPF